MRISRGYLVPVSANGMFIRAAGLVAGGASELYGVVRFGDLHRDISTGPLLALAVLVCAVLLNFAWRALVNGCRLKLAEWRTSWGR